MPRWLRSHLTPDIRQERELAILEGRDPKVAVREFLRQEHRFYDLLDPLGDGIVSEVAYPADPVLIPLPGPNRSLESKESRREASARWWQEHGREYRARRKAEGRPLAGGRQYRQHLEGSGG